MARFIRKTRPENHITTMSYNNNYGNNNTRTTISATTNDTKHATPKKNLGIHMPLGTLSEHVFLVVFTESGGL
jgi:hypothetical protein